MMKLRSTPAVAALMMTTAISGSALAQESGPVLLEGIIVSGSPLDRTADELATPVTVVDQDEVIEKGADTIGEQLKDKPGIAQSSFAPGASRPIIRGLDNFRIRIQENGIGTQDVSAESEDHAIPIDPLSAERIEVIRGPATLLYGSEAIGGVVSVLNNRIPIAVPEGGVSGRVIGGVETANEGLDTGVLVDVGYGRFAGHFDATLRSTDDYDTPEGTQENSYVESTSFAGGGSVFFENGYVGASVQVFESEYGIPSGEDDDHGGGGGHGHEDVFIDLKQVKVNVAGEVTNLGSFIEKVRARVGYSDYEHDEVDGEDGDILASFFNEAVEGRVEFLHAPIAGFEGAIGLQASRRDLSAGGEARELIAPAESTRFAAFIFEEVSIVDGTTLQLGGRVEHVNQEGFGVDVPEAELSNSTAEIDDFGADRDLDFTPVSASAAVIVDLADATSVGVSLQYSERAPSLAELFSKGPHEATETFEIGDPNLDVEKAISIELTAKRIEGPFRFEAAAFHTEFKDFIFKRLTGVECGEELADCGVESELEQVLFTAEDATFTGAEIAAEFDAFAIGGGVLGFDGQFDVVRAELDEGGNVPRIPPMRVGGGVYYQEGGFYSRVGVLYAFEQDELAEGETKTDGYTDVSAKISYTIEPVVGEPGFEIGIIGSNLLDEEIRNHSSFRKDEVLQPGASARIYGSVKF